MELGFETGYRFYFAWESYLLCVAFVVALLGWKLLGFYFCVLLDSKLLGFYFVIVL